MKDYDHARKRLAEIAKDLAMKHQDRLNAHKARQADIHRPDFLWHYLLQSFATMGRSAGWAELKNNASLYEQVAYDRLKAISSKQRITEIRKTLEKAGVRWPRRKAVFLSSCLERIEGMGGLLAAKDVLLAKSSREDMIAFLDDFPGIGDKYARNIMMDVYHEKFRDSIAIDARIKKIASKLRVSFDYYDEAERFFISAAHEAQLEGWELDRLMYNYQSEFLNRL
ncbi:MAG: hypothetical protein ACT4QE_04610 [Anaerolineales bacterium]